MGWICAWAGLLAAAAIVGGRIGLGTLLAAASIVQVTPSLWTAYRTAQPTGISQGTWALVFGELSCWFTFGLWKTDPRLIILGATGVLASLLMLARTVSTGPGARRSVEDAAWGDRGGSHDVRSGHSGTRD
jgi:hypothetical protein